MSVNEQGITLSLAGALLGLAGYFGWQQLRTLRGLESENVLGSGDRGYLRRQSYRRLFCSFLMATFGIMLIGWMFLADQYQEVRQQIEAAKLPEPAAATSDEQKIFLRFVISYWIGALLVLMTLLAVAAVDFWATVRYGLGQQRQLQADHRATLQEDVARHRAQRNGFGKPEH